MGNTLINILVAAITFLITATITKNNELELKIREAQRTRYENLITYVNRGFLDKGVNATESMENKKKFYEQSYIVWLYASDEVIRKLNNFAKAVGDFSKERTSENNEVTSRCLKELLYSMRKDTKGKTSLKPEEVVFTFMQTQRLPQLTDK